MKLAGRQAVSLKHSTLSVFAATLADEVGGSPGGITVKNTFRIRCNMFVVKYFTHRV